MESRVKNTVNDLMKYTHKSYWICRESTTGRGLRLHQTTLGCPFGQVYETPQQALDSFIEKAGREDAEQ